VVARFPHPFRPFLICVWKQTQIKNYNCVNCRTDTSPLKVPDIQIANSSPHVTPTSDSLSVSQPLCTFCSPEQYNQSTQEQSHSFRQNLNLNIHSLQICSKRYVFQIWLRNLLHPFFSLVTLLAVLFQYRKKRIT
jgi:hypothetical protein